MKDKYNLKVIKIILKNKQREYKQIKYSNTEYNERQKLKREISILKYYLLKYSYQNKMNNLIQQLIKLKNRKIPNISLINKTVTEIHEYNIKCNKCDEIIYNLQHPKHIDRHPIEPFLR